MSTIKARLRFKKRQIRRTSRKIGYATFGIPKAVCSTTFSCFVLFRLIGVQYSFQHCFSYTVTTVHLFIILGKQSRSRLNYAPGFKIGPTLGSPVLHRDILGKTSCLKAKDLELRNLVCSIVKLSSTKIVQIMPMGHNWHNCYIKLTL